MKSRGQKGLTTRYRPALFSEVVGHVKIKKILQEKWESGKRPMAYLLSGETGTGKTTLARIMAVSANCPHQLIFGEPCLACRKNAHQFDTMEIDGANMTGIDKIREAVLSYDYQPTPPSQVRTFILDEAQKMSDSAQSLLLKPFEDGPQTTLWIICTTNPQKILETLRGRCVVINVRGLSTLDTEALVSKVIESERSLGLLQEDFSEQLVAKFTGNLIKQKIFQPRNILAQLEKFIS